MIILLEFENAIQAKINIPPQASFYTYYLFSLIINNLITN